MSVCVGCGVAVGPEAQWKTVVTGGPTGKYSIVEVRGQVCVDCGWSGCGGPEVPGVVAWERYAAALSRVVRVPRSECPRIQLLVSVEPKEGGPSWFPL
jgi:hypothetical protein